MRNFGCSRSPNLTTAYLVGLEKTPKHMKTLMRFWDIGRTATKLEIVFDYSSSSVTSEEKSVLLLDTTSELDTESNVHDQDKNILESTSSTK